MVEKKKKKKPKSFVNEIDYGVSQEKSLTRLTIKGNKKSNLMEM